MACDAPRRHSTRTLITGDADPWDRFAAWAATVPSLIRSPLYVWTHLELRRVFGIDLVLSTATAREIWEEASLRLPALSSARCSTGSTSSPSPPQTTRPTTSTAHRQAGERSPRAAG